MTSSPDLFLLAGPNGAGKSTFHEQVLVATGLDLINADRIAAQRWPGDEVERAYEAAAEAAALRDRYISNRRSFILSVARVSQRAVEGGHDVPEDKIRQRHERLWQHVVAAISQAYDSRVHDSSGQSGQDFVEVARYRFGTLLGEASWPDWAPDELTATGHEDL